jgi:outer membrane biosynthesis protein TonB
MLIEGTISADGKIENIRILKSQGLDMDESVIKTLKEWKCGSVMGPNSKPFPS